jgi:hypothetical protein
MPLKLVKYIANIKKKALKFESLDINGNLYESLFKRHLRKFLSVIVSVLIIFHLKDGFRSDFIQYATTILSIFIGLFATALIFSFDRFYKKMNDKELEKASATLKLYQIKSYNFSKKFAYITGYNILLSIISIALLLLSVLFTDFFSINVCDYELVYNNLNIKHLKNLFSLIIIISQRFIVLYWLFSIFYFTLFLVSSLVIFMTEKSDIDE